MSTLSVMVHKRHRRTHAEIEAVRKALYETVAADRPMSVRQVFYGMVTRGAVGKTEAEYKGTVVRLLTDMRRTGEIPYEWIVDHTRLQRKPLTFDRMEDALSYTAQTYRRSLWSQSPVRVEVWCESDSVGGVLVEQTEKWDVPLMSARGFASETFLWSAAEEIKLVDRPTYLYHFGDHDPSGVQIDRDIIGKLHRFAPDAEIQFERVAVTEEQIDDWNLSSRPTKTRDTRSRTFRGDSVEIEAIPVDKLRQLASEVIQQHLDKHEVAQLENIERLERATLQRMAWYCNGDEDGDDDEDDGGIGEECHDE